MLGTLHNLSPASRRHWTVMTLPCDAAAALPLECTALTDDGRRMRAVRGRSAGNRTVYRVRAEIDGGENVGIQIVPEAHADAGAFAWHPWCSDDVLEMIPYIGAKKPDGTLAWSENVPGSLTMIDHSPAHQRWQMQQALPEFGLVVKWWITVLHDDPVAELRGKVVWSDRRDPSVLRQFDQLLLRCGELVVLDFAKRKGIGDPFQVGRDWAVVLNHEPIQMLDGGGLDLSGSILAHESVPSTTVPTPEVLARMQADLGNLVAAAHGPIVAGAREWNGRWLAAKNLPRMRHMPSAMAAADFAWNQFRSVMSTRGGWHADRMWGLSRVPSQAGVQSDFGATKGTAIVWAGDVRHIYALQHAAYVELLRGHNHYETDGSIVLAADHPNWVTWSRVTHYHTGVSTDRLGKGPGVPPAPWMHLSVDDEHMSANYLATYAMLSDDPLIDDQLRHILESDRASYRVRFPLNGHGATRAQGRTVGAWAQMACVATADVAQGFADLISRFVTQFASIPTMLPTFARPMKVPEWRGPDPRKPVYDLNGNLGRWASMWELGLYLVGMIQAKRSGFAPPIVDQILLHASSTIADFGFFQEDGQWYTVGDVLWSDGAVIPGGMVRPPADAPATVHRFTSAQGIGQPNDRGILSWTFAGLLVARDVLPRTDPRWDRLNEYVLAMTGNGIGSEWDHEATTFDDAEWWAVVQSMV